MRGATTGGQQEFNLHRDNTVNNAKGYHERIAM